MKTLLLIISLVLLILSALDTSVFPALLQWGLAVFVASFLVPDRV